MAAYTSTRQQVEHLPAVAVADGRGLWLDPDAPPLPPPSWELPELVEWAAGTLGVQQLYLVPKYLPAQGFELSDCFPETWRVRGSGAWVTGWEPGRAWSDGGARVSVTAPAADKGSPWATITDGRQLLAELLAFQTALGAPWVRSGAITSDTLLRRLYGPGSRLKIRHSDIPPPGESERGPAAGEEPPIHWRRIPQGAERRRRWCMAFDVNAQFLAAASSLALPIGPAVHRGAGQFVSTDKRIPGYWRITPRRGWDDRFADFPDVLAPDGELRDWVTTPTMELLAGDGHVPIAEAWTWAEHHRYLTPWYERIRNARAQLIDQGAALDAVKQTYRQGIGRLGSTRRAHERDPLYQPYWRHAVNAEARARLLRRLAELRDPPVAVDVDCAWFMVNSSSPVQQAKRLGIRLGAGLGEWKAIVPVMSGRRAVAALETRAAVDDERLHTLAAIRALRGDD